MAQDSNEVAFVYSGVRWSDGVNEQCYGRWQYPSTYVEAFARAEALAQSRFEDLDPDDFMTQPVYWYAGLATWENGAWRIRYLKRRPEPT